MGEANGFFRDTDRKFKPTPAEALSEEIPTAEVV
jgi:hypothetical protein